MARAKLGINRSEVMKRVHAACRVEVPGDLVYGEVTIKLPDGTTKTYVRRYIVRNRDQYKSCVARQIKTLLDQAARSVPGVRTK